MGVTGLWRLIEPTGKPVPVETLENKILAVDISIWLHQVVKGYQDAKGAPLPNAHLMGLFQRLCKLLYFRIKPVFVFDGGFPDLKKETIAKRQDNKSRYQSESERLKRELALLLSKKTAVSSLLGNQTSPKKASRSDTGTNDDDDLFKLPALPDKEVESQSESEDEDTSSGSIVDLHSMDLESENFKELPVKEKYDLLIELKETRKMNSWGRLHELPKKSDNFSDFQMQRLLKRRKVQECLEETEKEMGSHGMSLNDLENLLNEEGIETKIDSLPTRRIASNESTRFLLIKNVKKQLAEARKQKLKELNKNITPEPGPSTSSDNKSEILESNPPKADEFEDDLQKAIQMSLECVDEVQNNKDGSNTNKTLNKSDDSWTSFLSDSDESNTESDSDEKDGFEPSDMSCAKAYIMQYSDYSHHVIDKIVKRKVTEKNQSKAQQKLDEILSDLEKEKSIIAAKLDISSDEENPLNNSYTQQPITHSVNASDCGTDVIELNTTNEGNDSVTDDVQLIVPETTVVGIDDSETDVICIDTSMSENKDADIKNQETNLIKSEFNEKDIVETESTDDDDFEEVKEKSEPVVELTLKVGEDAPEDDIFADVFSEYSGIKDKQEAKHSPIVLEDTGKFVNKEYSNEISDAKENDLKDESSCYSELKMNDTEKRDPVNEAVTSSMEVQVKEPQTALSNTKNTDARLEITENPSTRDVIEEVSNENVISNENNTNSEITTEITREPLSTEQLNTMVEEMQNEERDLLQEKGRLDRIGRNITEQMTKDAQELLQVFGIPYIVAPMEAEAQCAFLESVNLTDGTITDDSDIWLFGGKTVYKNFFNQKKHVLQFVSERIEKSFNLSREQLILLALLVGSDYTTGVTGVGPVTAMEILASFPYNKKQWLSETSKQARLMQLVTGLQEFKKWVQSGKRTDDTSLKKKLKNVAITDEFPSVRVVQAYLEPNVEKSEDKFSWGELDITVLRDYTKTKFGWSQSKLDEILKPVLKRLQNRQTQKTLQDYFKRKVDFQNLEDQMSKRVKAAVKKMGPETPLCMQEIPDSAPAKVPRKRKAAKNSTKIIVAEVEDTKAPPKNNSKQKQTDNELISNVVKVKSVNDEESKAVIDIKIQKTDRFQEQIPQREKDKQCLLQNKMKAIEVFRKSKLETKRNNKKRRVNLPKEKAELSESDSD